MKKILTLVCALMLSFAMAQETKNMDKAQEEAIVAVMQESASEKRNDIMLNPIALILGFVDISYEYHAGENSGVGASTFFILDDYVAKDFHYWYFLPHYRHYFGRGWAKGFFIDGFAGLVGQEKTKFETYTTNYYTGFGYFPTINSRTKREKKVTFGIGAGLGGKWITKNNIIFETSLGVGRAFGDGDEPVFLKGMLGIGYRF